MRVAADTRKYIPNDVITKPHIDRTTALVFPPQNFFDLNVVNETKESHARSHDQCTNVNNMNAIRLISIAFTIREAPTVAHHKKK